MSLALTESLVLAKTRSQDLKSVLKLNCWGSEIKDVSLVRQLVNVEVIGLSCNEITTLEDFAYCTKLKELILRRNKIKNIAEIAHLQGLPKLTSLWLDENPCVQNTHNYRKVVLKALPNLTVLDNIPVTREELQEIEELGNEIYEEIPYESSNSSNSGPLSTANPPSNTSVSCQQRQPQQQDSYEANNEFSTNNQDVHQQHYPASSAYSAVNPNDHYLNDSQSYNQQPNDTSYDPSMTATSMNQLQLNESMFNTAMLGKTPRSSTSNNHQRCLSSQGSTVALNGFQIQGRSLNNNINSINNNNNLLPKGGKSRNGNILSAVLCLVKELDYVSCEVVQTALHCRMEETLQ